MLFQVNDDMLFPLVRCNLCTVIHFFCRFLAIISNATQASDLINHKKKHPLMQTSKPSNFDAGFFVRSKNIHCSVVHQQNVR